MWPFDWRRYQWPLIALKVSFAVWNLSVSHISENVAFIIYEMFTHESGSTRDLYFQLSLRKWRTSQGHRRSRTMHLVSRKRCKIRRDVRSYAIAVIWMTLSDLQGHSAIYCKPFQVWQLTYASSGRLWDSWVSCHLYHNTNSVSNFPASVYCNNNQEKCDFRYSSTFIVLQSTYQVSVYYLYSSGWYIKSVYKRSW